MELIHIDFVAFIKSEGENARKARIKVKKIVKNNVGIMRLILRA